MHSYSHTAGWIPSLIFAGFALILSRLRLSRPGRLSRLHAIGVGAAAFAASFSILNLALQPSAVSITLLHQELDKGRLALRVISIIAAITFLRLVIIGIKDKGFPELSGDYYEKDYKLFERESERRKEKWRIE